MTGNALVATPEGVWDGTQGVSGAGLLDSLVGTWDDLANNGDWNALTVGVDVLAVGLDVLSMALNPLGELVKAGVGWLMEHVDFIREPLELLTGDHRAIKAVSQTWSNIAQQLGKTATDYENAMSTVSTWTGATAEAYRSAASGYITGLRALAAHSDNTSQGIAIAGIIVATERAIIFDMIATFISRIITEALIAAASSAVTLGGSVAAFLTSVTVDATLLCTRLAKRLSKLLTVIKRFVKKFEQLGETGKKITKTLEGKSQQIHNWADKLGRQNERFKRDYLSPANSLTTYKYTRYVDRVAGTSLGEFADSNLVSTTNETLKSTKDNHDLATGKD